MPVAGCMPGGVARGRRVGDTGRVGSEELSLLPSVGTSVGRSFQEHESQGEGTRRARHGVATYTPREAPGAPRGQAPPATQF